MADPTIQNAVNFRDMGGLELPSGGRLPRGRLFRSGALAKLDDADIAALAVQRLALVVDLRSERECAKDPDRLPPSTSRLHCPINPRGWDTIEAIERFTTGNVGDLDLAWLTQYNLDVLELFPGAVRAHFEALAQLPAGGSAVFHCTQGKDRTGVHAALLLLLLGASEEQVLADYTRTNEATATLIEQAMAGFRAQGLDAEKLYPMLGAPAEALTPLLEHLRAEHGGAEGYCRTRAGLAPETLERLRERLLD